MVKSSPPQPQNDLDTFFHDCILKSPTFAPSSYFWQWICQVKWDIDLVSLMPLPLKGGRGWGRAFGGLFCRLLSSSSAAAAAAAAAAVDYS